MFIIIVILHSQALKQLPRDKVQLATKFGVVKLEGDRYGQYGVRGSPEYVRESCEASLKRLEVDYIDLYHPHRIDVTVPIEDTVRIKTLFPWFTYGASSYTLFGFSRLHSILMAVFFAFQLQQGRWVSLKSWWMKER